jgi:hypothetical protein
MHVIYASVGTRFWGPCGPRTGAEKATDGAGGSGYADRPPDFPPVTCHFSLEIAKAVAARARTA